MLWWAGRIAIFLLLGAIMTVLGAWACAAVASGSPRSFSIFRDPYQPDRATIEVTRAFGHRRIDNGSPVLDAFLMGPAKRPEIPEFVGRVWWPETEWEAMHSEVQNFASGWPVLALRCRYRMGITLDPASLGWEHSLNLARFGHPQINLPMRPLVIGFVVDMLFFGTIIAAVTFAIVRTRQMIRNLRHQCPSCAYPRGTSPVCTECGAPLPSRITTEPRAIA